MMSLEMALKLKKSLIEHEGYEKFIYTDSVGKLTGGIGYNFSDRGLSDDWINNQYTDDVNYFYTKLSDFTWFQILNDDRKIVLIDMCFNLGLHKLLEFTDMIASLEAQDYVKAASDMLNSVWASQTKGRAVQLSEGMLGGIYNV